MLFRSPEMQLCHLAKPSNQKAQILLVCIQRKRKKRSRTNRTWMGRDRGRHSRGLGMRRPTSSAAACAAPAPVPSPPRAPPRWRGRGRGEGGVPQPRRRRGPLQLLPQAPSPARHYRSGWRGRGGGEGGERCGGQAGSPAALGSSACRAKRRPAPSACFSSTWKRGRRKPHARTLPLAPPRPCARITLAADRKSVG